MAPPSYRLDTLAANLVARLEASRRSWVGDATAAREGIERIVREAAHALARECRETMGDEAQAMRLEREAIQTFLPRYSRLAVEQNAAERLGYGILPSGVGVRAMAVTGSFILATVVERVFHHPELAVLYGLPLFALVFPEIRTAWMRRGYQAQLQELVDDMGKVQDAVEALEPAVNPEDRADERRAREAARREVQ
jgi:hypothetical protein